MLWGCTVITLHLVAEWKRGLDLVIKIQRVSTEEPWQPLGHYE